MTQVRRGVAADAGPAAELWLRARRAAVGSIPAPIHDDDEVRGWFASEVVAARELWVAEAGGGVLAGILVLDDDWVDQLYVEPALTGDGVGTLLLDVAKSERPGGLRLWCFASNSGALRFYERHGFAVIDSTDGHDNEERAPDVLLEYRPQPRPVRSD